MTSWLGSGTGRLALEAHHLLGLAVVPLWCALSCTFASSGRTGNEGAAAGAGGGVGLEPGSRPGGASGEGGDSSSGGGTALVPTWCGEAGNAFLGSPAAIPGTIEAEDFDIAGYLDTSPGNEGAAYRQDVDVDIKDTEGGYALGWMTNSEWVEYTVEVATTGTYAVSFLAGSVEPGRTLDLYSCGHELITEVPVPQVEGWGEFEQVTRDVRLEAGRQVLRVTVGPADFLDLDAMAFELIGGAGSGGSGTGGGTGRHCALPSSWSWTSSGPLTEPQDGAASLKDFSVARDGDQYIVYGTTFDGGYKGFSSRFGSFDEWPSASQDIISGGVAPTLFYFEPKDVWVLADQWGACPFLYRTSTTPRAFGSWSARACMMQGSEHPGSGGTGPIDQSVICDDIDCYLFYADDAGGIYRGSMPVAEFPGQFTDIVQILDEPTSVIFEGVQVYSIKGSSQYLMIIENVGIRAFRAWVADSLDGIWTPLAGASSTAQPFAGENNVIWPDGKWTRDISHGDLVRENPSEKMEIDLCNLQMLYQGRDPDADSPSYDERPYRPGLLTLSW